MYKYFSKDWIAIEYITFQTILFYILNKIVIILIYINCYTFQTVNSILSNETKMNRIKQIIQG